MQNTDFKPREMDDLEQEMEDHLNEVDWSCDEGSDLAGFALAAISTSTAMKQRVRICDRRRIQDLV